LNRAIAAEATSRLLPVTKQEMEFEIQFARDGKALEAVLGQVSRSHPVLCGLGVRAEQATAMIFDLFGDDTLRRQVRARLAKRELFAAVGISSVRPRNGPPLYRMRASDWRAHAGTGGRRPRHRRGRSPGLLQALARGVGHSQAPARCLGHVLATSNRAERPLAPRVWSAYTRTRPPRRCRRASHGCPLACSRFARAARVSSALILIPWPSRFRSRLFWRW
jgi:hypothetical protein